MKFDPNWIKSQFFNWKSQLKLKFSGENFSLSFENFQFQLNPWKSQFSGSSTEEEHGPGPGHYEKWSSQLRIELEVIANTCLQYVNYVRVIQYNTSDTVINNLKPLTP